MANKPFEPSTMSPHPRVTEEVTDVIDDLKKQYTPEHFKELKVKCGRVLTFDYEGSRTTLKITKVSGNRYWAEHIELIDQQIVRGHYGHSVDVTKSPPFCEDCGVMVTEIATEDGEAKYLDRKERYLEDGTPIDAE